jgi:hypothetical protein
MQEMAALSVGEPEFFDLKSPGLLPKLRWTRLGWGGDILEDLGGSGRRTPNFAPDGRHPPAEPPLRTAAAATYSHGGVL